MHPQVPDTGHRIPFSPSLLMLLPPPLLLNSDHHNHIIVVTTGMSIRACPRCSCCLGDGGRNTRPATIARRKADAHPLRQPNSWTGADLAHVRPVSFQRRQPQRRWSRRCLSRRHSSCLSRRYGLTNTLFCWVGKRNRMMLCCLLCCFSCLDKSKGYILHLYLSHLVIWIIYWSLCWSIIHTF
jgi:hypothetical protein